MHAITIVFRNCNINFNARVLVPYASHALGRRLSSSSSEIDRQNAIFDKEIERQRQAVGRIEKIEINYEGPPENATYVMNKNLSTPYDVAKHIKEQIRDSAAVAMLNNTTLWHMHKPLPDSCHLKFLTYTTNPPSLVNRVFWRSCSFIMGALISDAFKDSVNVKLHSFPSPNVRSGSFVYDVQLSLDDWKPTVNELKVLSIETGKFCQQSYPCETVSMNLETAQDLFRSNPHKFRQLPSICANHDGEAVLFRVGRHIDISRGPLIANTNQVGRFTVTNVFKLDVPVEDNDAGPLYRFQGVALPKVLILNHFAYGLLEERARVMNSARLPGAQDQFGEEESSFVAQISQ